MTAETASIAAAAGAGQHGTGDEQLTLRRLAQERVLRGAASILDGDLGEQRISWCLPWEEALDSNDPLADVLIYARVDQVDTTALERLARRRAVAVAVAGAGESSAAGPLPVLAVEAHVTYRDVSRLVAELELARETHVLRYGIMVHRSLVELLHRGAGLAALCHQITRLSGCTTAVLDPQFRVLAFEQSRNDTLEPAAVASALRTIDLATPERDEVKAIPQVRPIEVNGLPATAVVNAILLAGRHDGWVAVIEPTDQPHEHDIAQHKAVAEQAATIVGTELLRMRSVEQAEERARGDFVHALLHGRFTTAHDLEVRAAHYDFPISATYGVVVAGLAATDGTESLTALFQLARDAPRISPGPRTLATVVGNLLAVIRQIEVPDSAASPTAADQALAKYAAALEQDVRRRTRHDVVVAYGRPVSGADRVFDSYREARVALALHHRLGLDRPCGFQDLRVFAMLGEFAASPAARQFVHDMLGPLREPRAGGNDLERAVICYIESGGNLNAAARTLQIHRNTMLYKLDRASRLLNLDLRDAEHQFMVWLAKKMDMLAEATATVDRDIRPT